MDVLLTHGYFIAEDEIEQKIMKPYVPLGILYIAGYLDLYGINNEVFDATFSTFEKQLSYIRNHRPKVIGIYTNLMTKVNVIKLVKSIKLDPDLEGIKLVLGGPDLTYNQDNYLATGVDALVIGEGEETFKELVEFWSVNPNMVPSNIPGVSYLSNGDLVKNPARVKIKDLAELALPARYKIDLRKYLDTWKKYHGASSITISTQRGCPYTCKWCSTAVYGQSYRRRKPREVVDELELMLDEYMPDNYWFVDDVFTVSHKWLKEFTEEIESRGLLIKFECISRADRMNEEVIDLLKRAGCFRVWIGAESGSQNIIDAMDRRVDVNQVRNMIKLCQQSGIEAGTFIMVGYPGETIADIKETIHHLKDSNPSQYTITKAYPIKGTDLYEEVEAHMVYNHDWDLSTDRDRNFKRTYSDAFYPYAIRYIVNEVESHKARLDRNWGSYLRYKSKSMMSKQLMQLNK